MIVVVFGTTGELIKLAPVLHQMERRSLPYLTVSTNQQVTQIPAFQQDLGLRKTDVELAHGRNGRDLEQRADIPPWLSEVGRTFVRRRKSLKALLSASGERHALMVHGDTMTTVLGAFMGKALSVPVAHLEAGMRSGNWRNPFPEELDRRITGSLASIHYAGSDREVSNLSRARGRVIKIGANTVYDSLQLVPAGLGLVTGTLDELTPKSDYGLVSLHRSELLGSRTRLEAILLEVSRAQLDYPLLFVDHPVTVHAIKAHGLDHLLANAIRIPRLRYTPFIQLLRSAKCLLTDSGGCQEECFYLDVPCLIHRLVTERAEGLGRNVVLSRYELDSVRSFLKEPEMWRMGSMPQLPSPSKIVVKDLIEQGFGAHG